MKIFYLCDRRACEKCNAHLDDRPECRHTSDVRHARNFELRGGALYENEIIECAEGVMELPGMFIDDERLAKIEGYLANLVDAQRKAAEAPQAKIKCDTTSELAAEIGKITVDGCKPGFIN